MSGIPMISTSRHTYNNKVIASSQDFEANDDADADDLEALHMAKRKQPKAKPQPAIPKITEPAPQVTTRDIDPAPEVQHEQQAPAAEEESEQPASGVPDVGQQARDKYNRRDMRAKR